MVINDLVVALCPVTTVSFQESADCGRWPIAHVLRTTLVFRNVFSSMDFCLQKTLLVEAFECKISETHSKKALREAANENFSIGLFFHAKVCIKTNKISARLFR